MIVVDSTIIAAWGVSTPWSGAAAALAEEGEALIAPQAALSRALEGIAALRAAGHVTPADFTRLATLLPAMLDIIVADHALAHAASGIASERDLGFEAALCVALAEVRDATLATADVRLARAAGGLLPASRIRLPGETVGSARETTAAERDAEAEEDARRVAET